MPPAPPDVSVVVTTYNRPKQLFRLLDSLTQQAFETPRFEVVVVDDGSEPSVEPVVNEFRNRLRLQFLRQANGGPAAGRNLGIAHANGRVIAFTDDDCAPTPNWMATLTRASEEHPGCMLGGQVVNGLRDTVCSEAAQMIVDSAYRYYNPNPLDCRFFASNNMACSAEQLRQLGGFDTAFRIASEDRNLCERWRFAGHRLVFVPELRVEHFHHLNLRSFWRMHFRYGRGAARFHAVRSAGQTSRLREHYRFYKNWRDWLLRPFRTTSGKRAVELTGLLIVWQMANASGFFFEKLTGGASAQ